MVPTRAGDWRVRAGTLGVPWEFSHGIRVGGVEGSLARSTKRGCE